MSTSTDASSSKQKKSQGLTPLQQDRQARNKDPFDSGSELKDRKKSGNAKPQLSDYEAKQRRRCAAAILGSTELLMMHAQARGDSVASTRDYFTRVISGYDDLEEIPILETKREREK